MSGNEPGHAREHEQHDNQECVADCFQIHNLHESIIQRSGENAILIVCIKKCWRYSTSASAK